MITRRTAYEAMGIAIVAGHVGAVSLILWGRHTSRFLPSEMVIALAITVPMLVASAAIVVQRALARAPADHRSKADTRVLLVYLGVPILLTVLLIGLLMAWMESLMERVEVLAILLGTVESFFGINLAHLTKSSELAALKRKVVILFISANPSSSLPLALTKEAQSIGDRLQATKNRDRFQLEQQWETVASDLPAKIMRFEPEIVHFSGHGTRSGELVFLGERGDGAQPADQAVISNFFRILGQGVKCVVLNACYSLPQAKKLVKHVPAVVGMSDRISDEDAVRFASTFYEALGYGKDVAQAFEVALACLDLANLSEEAAPELILQEGIEIETLVFGVSRSE